MDVTSDFENVGMRWNALERPLVLKRTSSVGLQLLQLIPTLRTVEEKLKRLTQS